MFAGSCKIAFNVRCARRSRSPQGENIRTDGSDKSAWSGKYDIKGECFTRNPHQIDNGRTNQNNTYRDPLKSTKWTNFISRVHSANAYSFELERNNSNNNHSPRKRQTLIYRCASYMYIYKMRLCFLRNKWERIENNRKTQQLHLNIRRKKKKMLKEEKTKTNEQLQWNRILSMLKTDHWFFVRSINCETHSLFVLTIQELLAFSPRTMIFFST